MAEQAVYEFVAWVRTGAGALLGGVPGDVSVSVGGAGEVVRAAVPYGPGDATALDRRAVVRTVPADGVADFEPNLFPGVELAHPGLPWMLSPPPDAQGRATPWIALVVVEEQAGVAVAAGPGGAQVLSIQAPAVPARELPDLAQAWAWAHAQTTGATSGSIDPHAFARAGGEARARLLAPRRLEAGKRYLACVVPVFAAGVAAILGDGARTGLAWTGTEASVRVPVYYAWRFGTGPGGDFASLAKLVVPEALGADVGHRAVELSAPDWGLPAAPGAAMELTGALRSPAWQPPALTEPERALGDAIAAQIDAAADPSTAVPPLPPPCYGSVATKQASTAAGPTWQRDANRDVRQRAAAGLGAAVVRANLDALVDAAWQAAGDAARANAAIRHAQLAAELVQRLARRHVAALPDDGEVLALARPLLARIHDRDAAPAAGRPTLAAAVRASSMPSAALAASLRRLGRAGGPLARRAAAPAIATGAVLARVDAKQIVPVPPKLLPTGAAGFDAISAGQHQRPRLHLSTPDAIGAAATAWKAAPPALVATARSTAPVAALRRITTIPIGEGDWTPVPISEAPEPVAVDRFAAAASRHQAYVIGQLEKVADHARPSLGSAKAARPLAAIRAGIEAQFAPERGIGRLLGSRLGATIVGAAPVATLQPLRIATELEQPLVHALQALSPEHALPGVGGITNNRAALAATAPEFVRALLVGANEELGRELLWRGFPAAREQTWLRSFWGAATPDIPPIEAWPDAGAAPVPASLVLVVRADVLHRYPNAVVYAQAARWDGAHRVPGTGAPLAPVMAASLGADVALFGFDLDAAAARGAGAPSGPAGWYFIIAEHPHEPRFGLAATPPATIASWRDVAWTSLGPDDVAGNYLRVDGSLSHRTFAGDPLRWGSDAAALAAITQRRAVRVAMHASTLLGSAP